jgi:ferric-dicitrate binding protein FerR (iron transport regulator)
MNMTYDDEMERLLNELVDGTLTAVDEQRLAEILRTDASARRQYRQFMALHADLHWDYAAAIVSQPEANWQPERRQPERRQPWKRWEPRSRWAVAGLLLIVVTGGFLSTWQWRSHLSLDQPVIGRIAPLAGEVRIAERGKTQAITREAELRAGASIQVVGLVGLAELRLDDGTEISLAGETRIDCHRRDGQTSLTLHEGHLSANVTHQAAERPLLILTPGAEMQVLGTRLAVSADDEASELGVRHGRVLLKRRTDGETVNVVTGQYAVVSQRAALEASPWPKTPETWSEDFESGLPAGWRYGQWLRNGPAADSRGVVLAARRFALDGSESQLHRITLPKQWMRGLWRLEEDTVLNFTFKMSRPGWFHIMMGVRSDDLNPSYIGNYELQSSFWRKGEPDEWQTVSVPFSAFRKNIRGVPYDKLPPGSPRAGDVVHLLWFNTGDVDRGLMIDRIWVNRSSQTSEEKP